MTIFPHDRQLMNFNLNSSLEPLDHWTKKDTKPIFFLISKVLWPLTLKRSKSKGHFLPFWPETKLCSILNMYYIRKNMKIKDIDQIAWYWSKDIEQTKHVYIHMNPGLWPCHFKILSWGGMGGGGGDTSVPIINSIKHRGLKILNIRHMVYQLTNRHKTGHKNLYLHTICHFRALEWEGGSG